MGYSLWGCEDSDTTEWLHFHFSLSCTRGGNGNPLRVLAWTIPGTGAWWAAVYGVAQSRTQLMWLSSSSSEEVKRWGCRENWCLLPRSHCSILEEELKSWIQPKDRWWCEVAQSCPTLCDPMDCSLPSSSILGFSRQVNWSGLPFPSPGDLPNPGTEPGSPALQADALPSEPPGKHPRVESALKMGRWLSQVNQFICRKMGWKGCILSGLEREICRDDKREPETLVWKARLQAKAVSWEVQLSEAAMAEALLRSCRLRTSQVSHWGLCSCLQGGGGGG